MRDSLRVRRDHIMLLIPKIHISALEAPKDLFHQAHLLFRSPMMDDDLFASVSSDHPLDFREGRDGSVWGWLLAFQVPSTPFPTDRTPSPSAPPAPPPPPPPPRRLPRLSPRLPPPRSPIDSRSSPPTPTWPRTHQRLPLRSHTRPMQTMHANNIHISRQISIESLSLRCFHGRLTSYGGA